jgi:hypothetical protein
MRKCHIEFKNNYLIESYTNSTVIPSGPSISNSREIRAREKYFCASKYRPRKVAATPKLLRVQIMSVNNSLKRLSILVSS